MKNLKNLQPNELIGVLTSPEIKANVPADFKAWANGKSLWDVWATCDNGTWMLYLLSIMRKKALIEERLVWKKENEKLSMLDRFLGHFAPNIVEEIQTSFPLDNLALVYIKCAKLLASTAKKNDEDLKSLLDASNVFMDGDKLKAEIVFPSKDMQNAISHCAITLHRAISVFYSYTKKLSDTNEADRLKKSTEQKMADICREYFSVMA